MNPYELARAALEKKQLNAADRGFSAILKKAPGHWQAMRDLGVVRLHQGRFADAEKLLRRALEIRPTDADARLQLAEMFFALKRSEEAIACYEEALAVDVACERAWVGLHRVFDGLGRGGDALERLSHAADAHPDSFVLQVCVGDMLARLDRHADALRFFVRALRIKHNDPVTQIKYATALYFAERYEESVAAYELALALTPSDAFCLSQKGNALFKLGRNAEAVSVLARALESKPGDYDALVGMGATLWRMGRNEEALSFLQAALGVNPRGTAAFNNLGHVMAALKADADAIVMFDRVHELEADSPLDSRLTAATCRLRLGNYAEGWRGYETRFSVARHPIIAPEKYAGAKRWNGEDLNGATLLVTAEQGHGDTVQFSRYMPMLARSVNGRVVFAVQAAVQPLLAPSVAAWAPAGNLTLASHLGELPHCDFHVPLMSLPLIFGTRVETIPSARKYLSVPQSYREKWRSALPANGKLRIGIAWSGNAAHVNDHNRSMPIAHLAPLLGDASVDWCVIQPGLSPFDQLSLTSVPHVFNAGNHLTDFADTAALIEILDVVVSVDTSVAHIAGALGKPIWLMLPWAAEWRWFHDRTDSPWYPSARLFRQPALGDWEGLVDNVQQALIEFARGKAASELGSAATLEFVM
ncbi:tetratricopeptide repeat protein [Pararobbsia alpina]|uniref:Beta-barrel assembly-enhancing protease n=1 Tax=Pararobbsia alpina TaxID=621374 RepID=A0A6S7B532_9BURK|nr:tetratricopeptide repeat protein [Pararobbsia alpina]CAB3778446.1 Beta-barrel assembly-enhancing protease [Pararobbsia alpina]